jgi:hypothetical protein
MSSCIGQALMQAAQSVQSPRRSALKVGIGPASSGCAARNT